MIRVPRLMKAEVIAFLDLYGEYVLEEKAPESRSDEPTRKKLIEDLKGMITFERNRLDKKALDFDKRRQKTLFE